jgi:hypothetical protein
MNTTPQMPKTLTEPDFKAIAEFCFETTEKALKSLPPGRQLPPCVLLGSITHGEDYGEIAIRHGFFPPLEDDRDKAVLTMAMDEMVQAPNIDFAVFIVESWMLVNPETLPDESIANHPRRQEAVIFSILSKDSQVVVANPLHRNPLRLERGELITAMQGRMVRPRPPAN